MKLKLSILIALIAVFIIIFTGHAMAQHEVISTVRVGLAPISQAKVNVRVTEGSYQLIDGATNLPITTLDKGVLLTTKKVGPNLKVYIEGKELDTPYDGPVVLAAKGEGLHLFSYSNTVYRGDFVAVNMAEGVLPVNKIDVEEYLYGVVGQEIGNYANMEALRAQAVVCRSYALALKGARGNVDLGTDINSQVYRGFKPETERVRQAVDDTKGQVILFDGQVIQAYFHSNAGGYTENSENVWEQELPYIKAVTSPYDQYAAQFQPQVSDWPKVTYSWEKSFGREQIYSSISQWNKMAQENRKMQPINVGSLQAISLSRLQSDEQSDTLSGRVTAITLRGDQGASVVERDMIRKLFDLRSTKFDMVFDSSVTVLDGSGEQTRVNNLGGINVIGRDKISEEINGNIDKVQLVGSNSTREVPKQFSSVIFIGNGYGHGLGMSQWGARGMAEDGYKYDEIIQHYYNQGKDDGRLVIKKIY